MYRYAVILTCLILISCSSKKEIVGRTFKDGYIIYTYDWGTRIEFKDFQVDLPQGWWVSDYYENNFVRKSGDTTLEYWGSFVTDGSNDSNQIEFMWVAKETPKRDDDRYEQTSEFEPNGFPTKVYAKVFGDKMWYVMSAHIFPANHWFVLRGFCVNDEQIGIVHEILYSFRLGEDNTKKRSIKQY